MDCDFTVTVVETDCDWEQVAARSTSEGSLIAAEPITTRATPSRASASTSPTVRTPPLD